MLALCAFLVSPALLAQVGNLPGQLFVSGTFGQATVGDDDGLKDDSDTAFGFGVGYMFHENLGFEAGYKSLGEYEDKPLFDTLNDGTLVTISGDDKVSGFNFGLIGVLPVQHQFDVYGKLGFHRWEIESNVRVSGGGTSISDGATGDGTDLYFGFGGKYNFSEQIAVGLEWVRYDYDDSENVTVFGVDLDVDYDSDVTVIGATVFVNF